MRIRGYYITTLITFGQERIEELRISRTLRYNTYNYTVPYAPFTNDADTRALWHFNEPAGSTSFSDSSSNGNALTGYNG
jgi:hypothetical protein